MALTTRPGFLLLGDPMHHGMHRVTPRAGRGGPSLRQDVAHFRDLVFEAAIRILGEPLRR